MGPLCAREQRKTNPAPQSSMIPALSYRQPAGAAFDWGRLKGERPSLFSGGGVLPDAVNAGAAPGPPAKVEAAGWHELPCRVAPPPNSRRWWRRQLSLTEQYRQSNRYSASHPHAGLGTPSCSPTAEFVNSVVGVPNLFFPLRLSAGAGRFSELFGLRQGGSRTGTARSSQMGELQSATSADSRTGSGRQSSRRNCRLRGYETHTTIITPAPCAVNWPRTSPWPPDR